jgi:hypothetical protein
MSVKIAMAAVSTAAITAISVATVPAHARTCSITSTSGSPELACSTGDGDESKLFEIKDTGVTSFFSQIGSNGTVQDVQTNTDVPVDTSNGYGEVKPSTNGAAWTRATFFPALGSSLAWDGLFVRGQIIDASGQTFDGNVFATVVDFKGNTTNFQWSGLPTNADIGTIGFDEPAGSKGIAIGSAIIFLDSTGNFKSMKQFDVSNCVSADGCVGGGGTPTIPEPSTWAMLLFGFASLGYVGYRGRKRPRLWQPEPDHTFS